MAARFAELLAARLLSGMPHILADARCCLKLGVRRFCVRRESWLGIQRRLVCPENASAIRTERSVKLDDQSAVRDVFAAAVQGGRARAQCHASRALAALPAGKLRALLSRDPDAAFVPLWRYRCSPSCLA